MISAKDKPKYILFSGYDHDVSGGTSDLMGYFQDVQSAKDAIDINHQWYEIVDIQAIPFIPVESGSVRDLVQTKCRHLGSYRVEPIPTGDLIVSGEFTMPGLYCRDCGKRLGD